ncbi:MAG TPA: AAA family ATPase [Planctomycetota bacterium]|nr:AAA family ATPase [Planctomycetota bacterium]
MDTGFRPVPRPVPPETDADRLRKLLQAGHPCILIQTLEEQEAAELLRKAAVELRAPTHAWKQSRGLYDTDFPDNPPVPDTQDPAAALQSLLGSAADRSLIVLYDLVGHLGDARSARLLRDLIEKARRKDAHVVLVDPSGELPAAIDHEATRFQISLPGEKELGEFVRELLARERNRLKGPVRLSPALWTSFLNNLRGLSRRQVRQVVLDVISDDGELDEKDLGRVLARKRQILQKDGLLDFVETPTSLNEIAGMEKLKTWLAQRKNALMDEARLYGLVPPRGLLMLGVPGSGKSLTAKAVATAWQRPLFRFDPSSLYDKYIGESERHLRAAFRLAEAMAPIVLWIDEIEKGFAGAASRSVDGGLSARMFGSLLTWMQEHRSPVFVIATANDVEALPPELLRKGRFDEIFFVDLPSPDVRRAMAAIHLRKRLYDPAVFDLDALTTATDGYTGAEIEQAVLSGMHQAFSRGQKMETPDILQALRLSPPLSVTMKERVDGLRDWARGRCAGVD